MDIDLKDPITKALFESYGEKEEKDFETAYLYMKYLYEFVSIVSQAYGHPPIPELAELEPEVLEKLYAKLGGVVSGFGKSESSVYHSKVIKLEDAEKLVTQTVDVHLEVPETVVPFKYARDVVLNNPDSIAVGTCPCRKANPESSCMPDPMEACMFLGDPYASFVAEHNPRFRKVTQEEAVAILEDCHEQGFVHCAYFKKDMGNRLYAICNCCNCCCATLKSVELFQNGALEATNLVSSGYVAVVGDDCTECEECVDCCLFNAISMSEDTSTAIVDLDRCLGCGVCVDHCTLENITLRVEPSKSAILDLDALKKHGSTAN
ncbi:MAG: 4Fe-4S ferredoxin [Proteobacteria bacterium]|nr:4Fe-4S ferredoxin [Pseudomonadota bacterium]